MRSEPGATGTVDAGERSPSRARHWALWALKLAVAGGLLAIIFRRVPLGDVIDHLRQAAPLPVAGALLLVLASALLSAFRLRIAGKRQGLRFPVGRIFAVNLSVSFYGLFLPGYLSSGAIRWHKLSRLQKGRPGILAAMAYSRLNFLVVLILLGVLFLALDYGPELRPSALLGLLGFLGGAFALHFLAFRGTLLWLFDAVFSRGRALPGWAAGRPRGLLLTASLYRRVPWRDRAAVWLVSTVENFLGIASILLLVTALRLDLGFANVAWVRSVILLLTAVPISIAGLGIREGGLLVLLEPSGVTATGALALSLLMFARSLFLGAIGAVLEAWSLLVGRPGPRAGGPARSAAPEAQAGRIERARPS